MIKAFVVGHPIAHSRSPMIHGHWLATLGLDGSYERIDVAPEDFGAFLRNLKTSEFAGGNVTLPHKEAAFAGTEVLTEAARRIGAVNTLSFDGQGRLVGDNTDAVGFTAHLDETLGPDWLGADTGDVVILGAGGAARAVVAGLLDGPATRILVANRTRSRAEAIAELDPARVEAIAWDGLDAALGRARLLINTTSLGMTGKPPLDITLDRLRAECAVADIVYSPLETPLLAAAAVRGHRVVDGLGMLLHQAVPGFERWFGTRPVVTSELRALIVADLVAKR
ncbi:shikimate dehydrogenase [Methylobacterium sp. W2]|uniref:shikimate dehydrogenase n=1 Tax=Methylobacterium sp. W2 TaxID=2598107 RepID=UPI001D0C6EBF|nr:shikimate dehydrogenase [Methylobacterium sp. W2]MCC0805544.1 shikimate dehydrogenase [Methylobacterium sp. W2]